MPNLRRVPGVTATKAKRGRRRPTRSKHGVGIRGWWRIIKLAWIVKRPRRRERSSPLVRQIVLVIVSGGLAIVIIRGVSRRVAAKRARSSDGESQDQAPAPEVPSERTTPGANDGLTERVRTEMFENKR